MSVRWLSRDRRDVILSSISISDVWESLCVTVKNSVHFLQCSRTFKQLHYVTWPDHGVPESIPSILQLLAEMRSYRTCAEAPVVIHCRSDSQRALPLRCQRVVPHDTCAVLWLQRRLRSNRSSVRHRLYLEPPAETGEVSLCHIHTWSAHCAALTRALPFRWLRQISISMT